MGDVEKVVANVEITGPVKPAAATPEAPKAPAADARPAWLPDKFKNAEEMAKAYGHLEKTFHEKNQPAAAKPPEAPKAPEAKPTGEPGKAADPAAAPEAPPGVPANLMREANEVFQKEGALTEEMYSKLTAAGFDREVVDTYVEGQKARAAQVEQEVYAAAGGSKENLSKMLEWVGTLPEAEMELYNQAASNPKTAPAAVKGMWARYVQTNGFEPNLLRHSAAGPTGSGETFQSTAQVTAAMRDPRYKTDPAYVKSVEEKIARSNLFNKGR